ncbi:MAG TPA: DUF2442 domain-containing protein [Tepidisphaeraceae bacterium]|nr:DUF2442 domain-containing protein [Tepidisphaeraceae bacterium]
MQHVISVKAGPDWELEVVFSDGTRGIVSLKDSLFGPVFEPLKDRDFFAKASVDEFGVICWPNGADLAPDALYERLKAGTHQVA